MAYTRIKEFLRRKTPQESARGVFSLRVKHMLETKEGRRQFTEQLKSKNISAQALVEAYKGLTGNTKKDTRRLMSYVDTKRVTTLSQLDQTGMTVFSVCLILRDMCAVDNAHMISCEDAIEVVLSYVIYQP